MYGFQVKQVRHYILYVCVGFKPGQRKVMFTCLKRNLVKEIKVAQLAGSVAEHSAYHHGEVNQTFMLTNFILLLPTMFS